MSSARVVNFQKRRLRAVACSASEFLIIPVFLEWILMFLLLIRNIYYLYQLFTEEIWGFAVSYFFYYRFYVTIFSDILGIWDVIKMTWGISTFLIGWSLVTLSAKVYKRASWSKSVSLDSAVTPCRSFLQITWKAGPRVSNPLGREFYMRYALEPYQLLRYSYIFLLAGINLDEWEYIDWSLVTYFRLVPDAPASWLIPTATRTR